VKLSSSFYSRPTIDVAVDLIGKVVVRPLGREQAAGMIVETEAYIGEDDLACHASKGRTRRTEVMFGAPGYAYVFVVYGVHHCLNAVTEPEGYPAAVLIRAIEPVEGLEFMRKNRPRASLDTEIGSGPAKLCQAMALDRSLNSVSLEADSLWIEDRSMNPGEIVAGPRIGVDYAGAYRDKPWRFFAAHSPHVSPHRFNKFSTTLVLDLTGKG
jgi:DNA-3-methyladenine glycosylase